MNTVWPTTVRNLYHIRITFMVLGVLPQITIFPKPEVLSLDPLGISVLRILWPDLYVHPRDVAASITCRRHLH